MTIAALTGSKLWLLAGWTMLHYLWVGGLLGLLGAALRRSLRRAQPEVRYGVALLGLAALVVAPALIAVRLVGASPLASSDSSPRQQTHIHQHQLSFEPKGPARPTFSLPSPSGLAPAPMTGPGRIAPEGVLSVAAAGLPWLWLIGAPATFLLLATGLIGAERLRRQSHPLNDPELIERGRRLAAALGLVRPVALAVCDRLAAPILLGVVRPMILLPASALSGWSPDQLEMALLHELAHVRRRDNLVNLLQRAIEALLFFHPAVWWVSGWIRREREHCCDRIVIAHTGHPRPYAELLATLAVPGASYSRAAVAMAEAPIVDRIRRILNMEDPPMRLSRALVALVAGLLIAPAALISSQAGPPEQSQDQPPAPPKKAANAGLESLIQRALHGAEMVQDVQDRAYSLAQVARAQAWSGNRDAAQRTFAQAFALAEKVGVEESRYKPYILLRIAEAQAKAGYRDEAIASMRTLLERTERLKDDDGKVVILADLMRAQMKLGDEEGRRETLRITRLLSTTTKDAHLRDSIQRSLIELTAESGDLAEALRMTHDPGLCPGVNGRCYHAPPVFALLNHIKAGDDKAAGPILEAVDRAVESAVALRSRSTLVPWVRKQDYIAAANVEARLGRFADAMKRTREYNVEDAPAHYVEKARNRYLDLRKFTKASTFASIAGEQAKRGDRTGVQQSTEEIARIAATISDYHHIASPLQRAAQSLARVGDLAGAFRLVELVPPDARAERYLAIATAQREANDEAGARATLETALRQLRTLFDALEPGQPDVPPNDLTKRDALLKKISRIQATQGDLKGAIKTIEAMDSGSGHTEALREMARIRADLNDLDGAMAAIGLIRSRKEEAEAIAMVLNILARGEAAG